MIITSRPRAIVAFHFGGSTFVGVLFEIIQMTAATNWIEESSVGVLDPGSRQLRCQALWNERILFRCQTSWVGDCIGEILQIRAKPCNESNKKECWICTFQHDTIVGRMQRFLTRRTLSMDENTCKFNVAIALWSSKEWGEWRKSVEKLL